MTVSAACTAGPLAAPVATSMPLGMSTATTGIAQRVDFRENLGGVRAQRSRAGDTDDPVDHQIRRPANAVDDPATGFAERGQALFVGALRLEQYRVGGRAAAQQVGCGPQRVAAVVAGSDHCAHPPSGDSPGASG